MLLKRSYLGAFRGCDKEQTLLIENQTLVIKNQMLLIILLNI